MAPCLLAIHATTGVEHQQFQGDRSQNSQSDATIASGPGGLSPRFRAILFLLWVQQIFLLPGPQSLSRKSSSLGLLKTYQGHGRVFGWLGQEELGVDDVLPARGRTAGKLWHAKQFRRRSYHTSKVAMKYKSALEKERAQTKRREKGKLTTHWIIHAGLSDPRISIRTQGTMHQAPLCTHNIFSVSSLDFIACNVPSLVTS